MTYNIIAINFLSKACKNETHNDCYGRWHGLGLAVLCDCECHQKNEMVLDGVDGTSTYNTFQDVKSASQEDIQRR